MIGAELSLLLAPSLRNDAQIQSHLSRSLTGPPGASLRAPGRRPYGTGLSGSGSLPLQAPVGLRGPPPPRRGPSTQKFRKALPHAPASPPTSPRPASYITTATAPPLIPPRLLPCGSPGFVPSCWLEWFGFLNNVVFHFHFFKSTNTHM